MKALGLKSSGFCWQVLKFLDEHDELWNAKGDSECKAARELAELLEQAFRFISGECEDKDPPGKFWEQEIKRRRKVSHLAFWRELVFKHFPNLPLSVRHVDHPNRLAPRHTPLSQCWVVRV